MKFSIEYTDGELEKSRNRHKRKLKLKYFKGIASTPERALARFEKFQAKHPEVRPTNYCSFKWNPKDFPYADKTPSAAAQGVT